MKLKIFFACLFITVIGSYIAFKNFRTKGDNKTFVVGIAANYAPFISINENGEYEGFDIDVIKDVAQKMNKKLLLKDLGSMSPLFIALQQGSIDAVIWGLSITQDRLNSVAMIRYQGEITTSYPLIFWQKIPAVIKTINDMKGMTVAVEPTSSQDAVLSKYSFINKKPTEKVDEALLNIQYGKTDAAFVEPAIAKKFKNKYPEIQTLSVELSPEDQVQGVGIAVKKNNDSLINAIQRAVNELRSEGAIQEYEDKWGIE